MKSLGTETSTQKSAKICACLFLIYYLNGAILTGVPVHWAWHA